MGVILLGVTESETDKHTRQARPVGEGFGTGASASCRDQAPWPSKNEKHPWNSTVIMREADTGEAV